MEFLEQLSPFVENVGFPALIFAIWYIYHQSQVKGLTKEVIAQIEEDILGIPRKIETEDETDN